MAIILCQNCSDQIRITDPGCSIQIIRRYEEICKDCESKGIKWLNEEELTDKMWDNDE
jgi:hypothetical protein